jgi:hypothetical protein
MRRRGAHQRRPSRRYDFNLADIALGFVVEVLLVAFLLAVALTGR